MRKKVTIVGGGGAVGATAAQRILDRGLADVVLADVLEGIPAGRALDMLESTPIIRSDVNAIGFTSKDNDYRETANSDVVVVTAGFPRKPGMSRSDLLQGNYEIIKAVVVPVLKHSPDAILIVVTNPLDAMAYAAFKLSGFPKHRVIGMAGVLDSSRMSTFVAQELGVSVANVHSLVLGGHGDTMVPLPRYTTVASIPLPELLPKERIEAINQRTRDGGAEIVNLMKIGGSVLRALRRCCRNGGSNPEGSEEDSAVRGVPGGRVWPDRHLHGCTGQAWRARRRADHRAQTDPGRKSRPAQVGGLDTRAHHGVGGVEARTVILGAP